MASDAPTQAPPLTDAHGRRISYLRISVTDRCDLRCRYCMSEKMQFLPRRDILSFEEIDAIAGAFVERGVRKIRLTGGEPLVRGGVMDLVRMLGRHRENGDLDELTMTTNATRLAEHAEALVDAGVRRVNVSLDTRDPETFRYITRWGEIGRTLDGIAAAKAAGLRVKINMVGLKGLNDREIVPMMRWCADEGHDLTLIETMPLGQIDDDRHDRYLPLDAVQRDLEDRFTLVPLMERTGGPARYWNVGELGLKLGLITPLTNNFCAGCNRVRITVSGKIYMCLGHDDHLDLKTALREGGREALDRVLDQAMILKPLAHDFAIRADNAEPAVSRHMSVTGG
ncbi:GTP 3',8-cyclase MoaA [Parasphingopyxis algicola]|uniref:GTP 3',8-cyclase MoaA n=1 Tax=Parasphingopyxis algicola TaxID=2026624 RepID=UPI0015A13200|nr:GTP 3',8-cyclase MoaA [Parasphingopyxis algicola]QLC24244.1 GTP 3',8-cyclase MoaA [Parasphingopyxis algicola]